MTSSWRLQLHPREYCILRLHNNNNNNNIICMCIRRCQRTLIENSRCSHEHTHTHTQTYMYIYIIVFVLCIWIGTVEIALAPFSSRPAVTRHGHEDYSNNCMAAAKGLRRRPQRNPDRMGCAPSRGHLPSSFEYVYLFNICI